MTRARPAIDAPHPGAAVFDAEVAAFLGREWLTCAVAARDASNRPSLAQAQALRLRADLRTVEVFLDRERAGDALLHLRAGSPIALVCSEPASHRTIQLKGECADEEPADEADRALVAERFEAVVAHIVALGHAAAGIRAHFTYTPQMLTKIVFVAQRAFGQTPGPGAGAPLAP